MLGSDLLPLLGGVPPRDEDADHGGRQGGHGGARGLHQGRALHEVPAHGHDLDAQQPPDVAGLEAEGGLPLGPSDGLPLPSRAVGAVGAAADPGECGGALRPPPVDVAGSELPSLSEVPCYSRAHHHRALVDNGRHRPRQHGRPALPRDPHRQVARHHPQAAAVGRDDELPFAAGPREFLQPEGLRGGLVVHVLVVGLDVGGEPAHLARAFVGTVEHRGHGERLPLEGLPQHPHVLHHGGGGEHDADLEQDGVSKVPRVIDGAVLEAEHLPGVQGGGHVGVPGGPRDRCVAPGGLEAHPPECTVALHAARVHSTTHKRRTHLRDAAD
mmetsp:Transcript_42404/g.135865  ORF Transcript_42404/g.135865 Transcript_42404/m.135865 type:complete len:327 (+) Transcript_42404:1376-2356(+)